MARHLIAAAAAALTLAACGGDETPVKESSKASGRAIGAGQAVTTASLLGDGGATASAGEAEGYLPEGEIVADSGFRPEVDGFGFENYGNDVEPKNLTTAEVQSLFGDQVCIGGDGEDCRLIPPAKRWMTDENQRMAGGHCMGLSVAALRMFGEQLDVTDFGAPQTVALEIVGNTDLQSSIAEHWVYQDLPGIQEQIVEGTPSEVVDTLAAALESGKEAYTLGILMADGTGGHAITPFAVEDKGDGKVALLAYDNNFPGVTRAVEVDVEADTWSYVGGTNPKDLGQVYEGNAETRTMLLLPTSPGEEQQPCPFCREQASEGQGEGFGTALGDDAVEVTLTGDPADHPHLVFTDDEGRQTGIIDGKMVNAIPGVKVQRGFGVQNWDSAPEPRYRLPKGKDFQVTIDGTPLEKARTVDVAVTGNGLVISVEELKVRPDQQDELLLSGDGLGLYYTSNDKEGSAPELYAGLEDGKAAYTFAASAEGLKPGAEIGLVIDRETGTVLLDGEGVKGQLPGDSALFVLLVGKETATRSLLWGTDELQLSGKTDDGVVFNYRDVPARGKPLELGVGPEDGDLEIVEAPFQP